MPDIFIYAGKEKKQVARFPDGGDGHWSGITVRGTTEDTHADVCVLSHREGNFNATLFIRYGIHNRETDTWEWIEPAELSIPPNDTRDISGGRIEHRG